MGKSVPGERDNQCEGLEQGGAWHGEGAVRGCVGWGVGERGEGRAQRAASRPDHARTWGHGEDFALTVREGEHRRIASFFIKA